MIRLYLWCEQASGRQNTLIRWYLRPHVNSMLIPIPSWLLLLRIILCPAFAWVNGKKPGIHHLHKHFVAGNNHVDRAQIFHHHLYHKLYIWMIICTCCCADCAIGLHQWYQMRCSKDGLHKKAILIWICHLNCICGRSRHMLFSYIFTILCFLCCLHINFIS